MRCSIKNIWYSIVKPYQIEIILDNTFEHIIQNNYHGNVCIESKIIYNPNVYFSLLHYYINFKKVYSLDNRFILVYYTKKSFEENRTIIQTYFDDNFLYG